MDNSLSENELSMSPSQILERLELLRHMQLMQREKLQKQRLLYQESHESSSTNKDYASDFTNSTSYSRLPQEINEGMSTLINNIIMNVEEKDLSDGVAVLNISQESELPLNSPMSSTTSKAQSLTDKSFQSDSNIKTQIKKQIALDDMPILSPRKDFETMLLEKIQSDNKIMKPDGLKVSGDRNKNKKPFLKRGEGMARFGLHKKDLVVEKTSSLPWRSKSLKVTSKAKTATPNTAAPVKCKEGVEKVNKQNNLPQGSIANCVKSNSKKEKQVTEELQSSEYSYETIDSSNCEIHAKNKPIPILKKPTIHPLKANKGKTWAAVFTKEQDEFLKQLKQSEYYKNFASPSKSIASELSCNESFIQLRQERETAEQNMFNLLENKVMNESFTLESSFFNKFLRNSQFECSGESTPLVLQKCLAKNPNLLHILPEIINKQSLGETNSDVETCDSEYTDCDNETCTSVSSCCSSCVTTKEKKQPGFEENTNNSVEKKNTKKNDLERKKVVVVDKNEKCHNDIINENDAMKANMTEMNNKLIATSDLLKDRLKELEDEIETFRKENSNLIKLREELDTERQKLYEEKSAYEQKFNEEKILSEYYLAEEKEKLNKQKLIYDKYVREIRGRLNKKDKDEVVNLKKEISNLKDEIRIKDAKSTSTIARLRNQLKILEKEKNNLQEQVAKIEKENRRLHHSNEMTRRLTNIKYLEQINKKLLSVPSKTTESTPKEDNNVKYKSYEIERQSRNRRIQAANENTIRPRAKSVPNMNVTSRYAKYFSQKDVASDIINKKTSYLDTNDYDSEVDDYNDNYDDHQPLKLDDDGSNGDENDSNDIEIENNLERLYVERFKSAPPCENKSNNSNSDISLDRSNHSMDHRNGFFFQKSNSIANFDSSHRESPGHQNSTESTRSKSPISVVSQRPCLQNKSNPLTNKAPASILSNRSSGSQISSTNGNYTNEINRNTEQFISKTSVTRTNLNPREIIKSDGTRELTFSNGNVKLISPDGKYTKFIYYNGDVKENFYGEGRIKYFYAETKTYHTTHPDGLEVLEFPDGQIEKRYKDGSSEIRLPNGSVRYQDPKSQHVKEEWRFPDGTTMTVSAAGEQRVVFPNGQVEVHAKDHKRREFPDGTVKLVYSDGTSETRYSSGRVRIKDKQGNLIMDSAPDG